MWRELVRQLVAEGCHVAMCGVSARHLAETEQLCQAAGLPQGVRVTSHFAPARPILEGLLTIAKRERTARQEPARACAD
jgi:hypothetical protein